MLPLLLFPATLCTALFAGASLYINVAEHPARMRGDMRAALVQWAVSYKRATWLQAPLAVVGLVAFLAAWLSGASAWWLVAGVLILAQSCHLPSSSSCLPTTGFSGLTRYVVR
jgi:hypothetical protein